MRAGQGNSDTVMQIGESGNASGRLTIFGEPDEDNSPTTLAKTNVNGNFGVTWYRNAGVDMIADGTFDDTDDSMTADPESSSESGFIEVQVNGTTKQVPFYDP
jgi:hypothetical protein